LGLSTTSRREKFRNSTETEHLRGGQRVCLTVSRPVSVYGRKPHFEISLYVREAA